MFIKYLTHPGRNRGPHAFLYRNPKQVSQALPASQYQLLSSAFIVHKRPERICSDSMQTAMNECGYVSVEPYLQKDTAGWIAISCFTWEKLQLSVGVRI